MKNSTQEYNYHDFHTPMLEDPDFEAKPLVMVMGQYSTGKTTFIRLSMMVMVVIKVMVIMMVMVMVVMGQYSTGKTTFIRLSRLFITELSFRCCYN